MEWADDAFVLGARPFGEGKAIVDVFARAHGRAAGLIYSGRKSGAAVQAGNLVRAAWRARNADQLGAFTHLDVIDPVAARAMADPAALAGVSCTIAMVRAVLQEREPYPDLFEAMAIVFTHLAEPELWPILYTRFELGLLAALGYGLDLSACALTGETEDLAFVSPRSGRAASAQAGAPFAEKLLRLSPFLARADQPVASGDVADAFALCGFFLENRVFNARGQGLPDARRRLIEALGHSNRL